MPEQRDSQKHDRVVRNQLFVNLNKRTVLPLFVSVRSMRFLTPRRVGAVGRPEEEEEGGEGGIHM